MNTIIFYLREPFDHTMERALQIFCAGPKENRGLSEKIQFIVSTLFYLVISPLTLCLFSAAGVLDALKQKIHKTPFTLLKGSAPVKERGDISLLTWNVCMLFGGLPLPFGGMRPVSKRISGVARKIIESKADIVCLQEVSPPAAHRLYASLKNEYKYFYTRINPDPWLMLDSGLFVASKVPIENPHVIKIPLAARMKRALFAFQVGSLKFGTTHLEPGNDQADKSIRKRQILEILKHDVDVLLGDLNIERGEEYLTSGLAERFRDDFLGGDTTADNLSIDYILTKQKKVVSLSLSGGLSDHHLLSAF